jgi:hypothetical protein
MPLIYCHYAILRFAIDAADAAIFSPADFHFDC